MDELVKGEETQGREVKGVRNEKAWKSGKKEGA